MFRIIPMAGEAGAQQQPQATDIEARAGAEWLSDHVTSQVLAASLQFTRMTSDIPNQPSLVSLASIASGPNH